MRTSAANRRLYQQKFDRVLPILAPVLPLTRPDGGFYLWPQVGGDEEAFARALFERYAPDRPARQLPGARGARREPRPRPDTHLAGADHLRTVHRGGATRLRDFLHGRMTGP